MKLTNRLLRKSIDCGLNIATSKLSGAGLALVLVPLFCIGVAAQQNAETPPIARVGGPPAAVDTRYRIGPGDVLTVLVRKAPELSIEAVRVDQGGMIHLPLINAVSAACKTEIELATQIATLYLEYKNNPSVNVFVKDFQSQPVAVMGAVDKPGQFRLQRQVRLLELISFAGGPTDKAGRVIRVVHTGGRNICAPNPANGAEPAISEAFTIFNLNETMKGGEESNPYVRPGDIVSLPEADQVFVVGYVYQPRSIPMKDKPITVSNAIAMAGGPQRDASITHVRIIRQTVDGANKQEIPVDLKAIMKLKAEDITLLPNDIVQVGTSGTKTLMNILTGTLPGALSSGVIRAIP